MIDVLVLRNWGEFWMSDEQFLSQCSDGPGIHGEFRFHVTPLAMRAEPDCVVVLNRSRATFRAHINRQCVMGIIQEPPNEIFRPLHAGQSSMSRVYCQDTSLHGPRYIHSHPAIPWFVRRSHKQLRESAVPDKTDRVSCITSGTCFFRGHKRRLRFLNELISRCSVGIELFGRSVRPIRDKWDGLAPFKYSIVLENMQCPYYWTEKLADCFLAFTLPIYCGCENIDSFFPEEGILRIDIRDPAGAVEQIREAVQADAWRKRLDAIEYCRSLILEKYGFFSFAVEQLSALIEQNPGVLDPGSREDVTIRRWPLSYLRSLRRSLCRKIEVNVAIRFSRLIGGRAATASTRAAVFPNYVAPAPARDGSALQVPEA